MSNTETVVAVFADHQAAEAAVKKLASTGLEMKNLSIVGKGYHTEEKVVGFYNMGDRMRIWGERGAIWGGLWGLFLGGMFLTIPVIGHVIVLGYLAVAGLSAIEGAVVVGGVSAIGAALVGIGVPKDSVLRYETAISADSFLVMAHGSADEMVRAKATLAMLHPSSLEMHAGTAEAAQPVPAA